MSEAKKFVSISTKSAFENNIVEILGELVYEGEGENRVLTGYSGYVSETVTPEEGGEEQTISRRPKYWTSIVFVNETHQIWNRGECFTPSKEELENFGKFSTELGDVVTQDQVGGIVKGTTASSLNGLSVSSIIERLLFPEVNPTISNPSLTISFVNSFISGNVYEVNTTLPSTSNLSYSFSRGTIVVGGQTTRNTVGSETGHVFSVKEGNSSYSTDFSNTQFENKTYTYKVNVQYEAGDQPVTSYGNNYGSPRTAGNMDSSNTISVSGVYPVFATTGSNGSLEKKIVSSNQTNYKNKTWAFSLTKNESQYFMVKESIFSMYGKNPLTSAYDVNITNNTSEPGCNFESSVVYLKETLDGSFITEQQKNDDNLLEESSRQFKDYTVSYKKYTRREIAGVPVDIKIITA